MLLEPSSWVDVGARRSNGRTAVSVVPSAPSGHLGGHSVLCVSRLQSVCTHAAAGRGAQRGLPDQGRGTKPASGVRSRTALCTRALGHPQCWSVARAGSAGRRGRGHGAVCDGAVRPARGTPQINSQPTSRRSRAHLLCLAPPAPTPSPESRPGGYLGPPCRLRLRSPPAVTEFL